MISIILKKTAPSPSGEEVVCKITMTEGRHIREVSGEIALEFFVGLGIPSSTDEPTELTTEQYDKIEHAMKKTDAVKRGLNLLSFSQNTRRTLFEKLVQRGFSKEIAWDAVTFLHECGYMDEYGMACDVIEDMATRRRFGPLKIKNELFTKGFPTDIVARAMEETDVDFIAGCVGRIEDLGGLAALSGRDGRFKTFSALSRAGYTMDEIREAINVLKDK